MLGGIPGCTYDGAGAAEGCAVDGTGGGGTQGKMDCDEHGAWCSLVRDNMSGSTESLSAVGPECTSFATRESNHGGESVLVGHRPPPPHERETRNTASAAFPLVKVSLPLVDVI